MTGLVVTDVDGTLVSDGSGEGSLNIRYFTEINRLCDKGIKVVISSGRQYKSI